MSICKLYLKNKHLTELKPARWEFISLLAGKESDLTFIDTIWDANEFWERDNKESREDFK